MANLLTIIRIIGTIPLIILIYKNGLSTSSLILFVLISVTDFLDGYIARKYNMCTKLGNILDGIADKFLMLSTTIVLLIKEIIPYWTLLIFIRDLLSCIVAITYARKTKIVLKSNIYGKLKTALHIFSMALVLLIGKWNVASAVSLIIAISLLIPESNYVLKILKNKN